MCDCTTGLFCCWGEGGGIIDLVEGGVLLHHCCTNTCCWVGMGFIVSIHSLQAWCIGDDHDHKHNHNHSQPTTPMTTTTTTTTTTTRAITTNTITTTTTAATGIPTLCVMTGNILGWF